MAKAGPVLQNNNGRIRLAQTFRSMLPRFTPLVPSETSIGRLETGVGFKWIRDAVTSTQRTLEALHEAEDLYRLLFEKVPHPRFVCDARRLQILDANEAAVRHYGLARDELLRMKVTELSAPECISDFKAYCVSLTSARRVTAGRRRNRVFRHLRKDGRLMDVEIDAALVPLRGRPVFLLLAQDVTEKQRATQRMRAQQAVTRALAECSTLTEASPMIFRAVCENLGGDWGELWSVDPSTRVLRCIQVWPAEGPRPAPIERHATCARGEGIPGLAWARNKTVWIADLSKENRFLQARAAGFCGFGSAYALPVRLNREVLGVIVIYRRQPAAPEKHLLRLLNDICSQVGQVMGRRRAERQLLEVGEREQERIGQDLHDGLCQQLAGIAYLAGDLERRLANKSADGSTPAGRIAELSRGAAVQARQIAHGLNPVGLETMGLMAALQELASSIRSIFSISCRFNCDQRILITDHDTAVHLYRITQEAIHNSLTHGKATEILVTLRRERVGIVLSVVDNGSGLFKGSSDGMGLENMNYRARAIGAMLQFRQRVGGGLTMSCTLPRVHWRSK